MSVYEARKKSLVSLMREEGYKATILSPSGNLYYMTGFDTFPGERFLAAIFTASDEVVFIVPKLYEQEVRETASFDRLLAWDDSQDPAELLLGVVEQYGLHGGSIAVEDTMWFCSFEKIMKAFEGTSFKPASNLVGKLRVKKSPEEIGKLKIAGELADKALANILASIKTGMTELEIKEMLEKEMKLVGLSAPSFDTIIGSGSNSALPHYTAGSKPISEGDAVVVDFGGIFDGYCSDMTRTLFIGKPTNEYVEVYNTVKEAQQKAIDAVRPGMSASEIDAAAREYITSKGYGEYFIHRTGHGIGMEVHENPYISEKSSTILEAGMAFSIEPGIYLPGKFGVRIEDIVVVTESGALRLNNFTKELTTI